MIPSRNEINNIFIGLGGWADDPNVLAPNYFSLEYKTNSLFEFIHNKLPLPEENFYNLARCKTQSTNFQSFIINEPIKDINDFEEETTAFLEELQHEVIHLNKRLEKVGFSEKEKEIFNFFVSKTSPILFNMGFSDAIPHSAQVTRRCIVEAYKRGASNYEILQSAMVGWLHDPKVPLKYSWNNLATHPIIASGIALNMLNQDEFKEKLNNYLNSLPKDKSIPTDKFIHGVAEALAINNDSDYVLKFGILYRPEWAPGPEETKGIIDQILEMDDSTIKSMGINISSQELADSLEQTAISWFESSSKTNKIKVFDKNILAVIDNIYVETGIRGILKDSFYKAVVSISNKYTFLKNTDPLKVFNLIINGGLRDPEMIKDLRSKLEEFKNNNDQIYNVPLVSGTSLFCHHMEIEDASIAALSLQISDPLLLSPQKLLIEGVKDKAIDQLDDFLNSFIKNIHFLPIEAQNAGKVWQRDLYVSLVSAAEELTEKKYLTNVWDKYKDLGHLYQPFSTQYLAEIDINIIESQISDLEILIRDVNTWMNLDKGIDFANFSRKDPANKHILNKFFLVLSKHYDLATEKSPEMFSLISIDD